MWWARLPSTSNVLTEAHSEPSQFLITQSLECPCSTCHCLHLFSWPPPPGKSCPLGVNCKKHHSSTVCGCFKQSMHSHGPSTSSGEAPNSGSWLPESTSSTHGTSDVRPRTENNRLWFGSFPDAFPSLTRCPPCPQSLRW